MTVSRGAISIGALTSLPAAAALLALVLAPGVGPWGIVAIAMGGALLGGLAVFIGHRWWGARLLRKLEQIDLQLGTVATETSIASGETAQLRAELGRLRQALGVHPAGVNPPPPPTSRERP